MKGLVYGSVYYYQICCTRWSGGNDRRDKTNKKIQNCHGGLVRIMVDCLHLIPRGIFLFFLFPKNTTYNVLDNFSGLVCGGIAGIFSISGVVLIG